MKKKRDLKKLQCTVCKRFNYYVYKSRGAKEKKLAMKKFCKWCKKHTPHKEVKV